jgi:hypothetical protein
MSSVCATPVRCSTGGRVPCVKSRTFEGETPRERALLLALPRSPHLAERLAALLVLVLAAADEDGVLILEEALVLRYHLAACGATEQWQFCLAHAARSRCAWVLAAVDGAAERCRAASSATCDGGGALGPSRVATHALTASLFNHHLAGKLDMNT